MDESDDELIDWVYLRVVGCNMRDSSAASGHVTGLGTLGPCDSQRRSQQSCDTSHTSLWPDVWWKWGPNDWYEVDWPLPVTGQDRKNVGVRRGWLVSPTLCLNTTSRGLPKFIHGRLAPRFAEPLDEIFKLFGEFHDTLPYLKEYIDLYHTEKVLQDALSVLYEDYPNFCLHVVKYLSRNTIS